MDLFQNGSIGYTQLTDIVLLFLLILELLFVLVKLLGREGDTAASYTVAVTGWHSL